MARGLNKGLSNISPIMAFLEVVSRFGLSRPAARRLSPDGSCLPTLSRYSATEEDNKEIYHTSPRFEHRTSINMGRYSHQLNHRAGRVGISTIR